MSAFVSSNLITWTMNTEWPYNVLIHELKLVANRPVTAVMPQRMHLLHCVRIEDVLKPAVCIGKLQGLR